MSDDPSATRNVRGEFLAAIDAFLAGDDYDPRPRRIRRKRQPRRDKKARAVQLRKEADARHLANRAARRARIKNRRTQQPHTRTAGA